MMFLALKSAAHDWDNERVYIDPKHIVKMMTSDSGLYAGKTVIHLLGADPVIVKETPEQVSDMIYALWRVT